jgi:methylglyoxal synthase
MNALLGIAKVAHKYNRRKVVKWCAIKRHQQLSKEWEKQKATATTVAMTNDFEELGW